MFVNSLEKLNEDVQQHVATAYRSRNLQPRPGMLVLAQMSDDNQYVLSTVIVLTIFSPF